MTSSRSAWIFAWALLAPAIIYVLIIVAWPLVETLRLSFTDASLRKEVNFVGWRNYEKIFNENGELIGVSVVKGNSSTSKDDNQVDAISGATITGDGVSDMISERLRHYLPYFKSQTDMNVANN